jgi:hypothetical protein
MSPQGSDFHNHRNSLHYAQARYVCMYLQQQRKLAEFYKTYRDNFKDDPSGQKSLENVMGKTVEEKDWIEWFLKIPAPK